MPVQRAPMPMASDAAVEVSTPAVAVAPRRSQTLTASSAPAFPGQAEAQPSRELVLARREALSRRGKTADKTSDRNRADVARNQTSSCGFNRLHRLPSKIVHAETRLQLRHPVLQPPFS